MSTYRDDRQERIRPAILELAASQEALFEDLEDGFDDPRRLILWFHKASARTLGRIPDTLARDVLSSNYRRSTLVRTASSPRPGLQDLEKRLLRDDQLLQAATQSIRFMAQNAGQYADLNDVEGGHGREFGPQRWLAMRPSLDELVTRQRRALKRALGLADGYPNGLEDHDDVAAWVRTVIQASRGMASISQDAIWSGWWRQALLDDPRRPDLHLLLVDDVLGTFNRAIREEASAADEAADEEGTEQQGFSR